MHTIEIAGHTFVYRNAGQLNDLLAKRLEGLKEQEGSLSEKVLRLRSEKKAIAKYLGLPLGAPEVRLGADDVSSNAVETKIAALSR